jgi:transcriptional regulator with XRE-family HTH domain
MSNFFNRLWSLRPEGIETYEGYAKFLGIHRRYLHRWKTGTPPRIETVTKVAKALNVDPAWLLFEPGDRGVKRTRNE